MFGDLLNGKIQCSSLSQQHIRKAPAKCSNIVGHHLLDDNVGHVAKCSNTVGQHLLDDNLGRAAKCPNVVAQYLLGA